MRTDQIDLNILEIRILQMRIISCCENGPDIFEYPREEDPLDEDNFVWSGNNQTTTVLYYENVLVNPEYSSVNKCDSVSLFLVFYGTLLI